MDFLSRLRCVDTTIVLGKQRSDHGADAVGQAGRRPNPKGCADFGRVLCCSSVKDHSGYSPSSRRAPSQNSQQRCYTSLRLGAPGHPRSIRRPRTSWIASKTFTPWRVFSLTHLLPLINDAQRIVMISSRLTRIIMPGMSLRASSPPISAAWLATTPN
jgi:hypothetical protein